MDVLRERYVVYRKCFGVLFLLIEMNLLGGTIFGFPSIFKILSKMKIYQNLCESSSPTNQCIQHIQQYQVRKIIFKNIINFILIYFLRMH